MKAKFLIVLFGVFVAVSWGIQSRLATEGKAKDYFRTLASGEDTCKGKNLCLVVYLAPWCPACKSQLSKVSSLLEKSKTNKTYGAKAFVGKGATTKDNEKMAAQLGKGAYVDNTSEMHDKLGVRYYPAFFVLDKDGSVVIRDDEAYYWAMEKLN
jgi:thiol-disulfide isomerase/thioredoxin